MLGNAGSARESFEASQCDVRVRPAGGRHSAQNLFSRLDTASCNLAFLAGENEGAFTSGVVMFSPLSGVKLPLSGAAKAVLEGRGAGRAPERAARKRPMSLEMS